MNKITLIRFAKITTLRGCFAICIKCIYFKDDSWKVNLFDDDIG